MSKRSDSQLGFQIGALIAGLRARDRSAQRELWVGYRDRLPKACCALREHAEIQDVVAGVLIDFMTTNVDRFRGTTEPELYAYLRLSAKRRSIRRARRLVQHCDHHEDGLPREAVAATTPTPEEAASDAELLRRLPGCLKKLNHVRSCS